MTTALLCIGMYCGNEHNTEIKTLEEFSIEIEFVATRADQKTVCIVILKYDESY